MKRCSYFHWQFSKSLHFWVSSLYSLRISSTLAVQCQSQQNWTDFFRHAHALTKAKRKEENTHDSEFNYRIAHTNCLHIIIQVSHERTSTKEKMKEYVQKRNALSFVNEWKRNLNSSKRNTKSRREENKTHQHKSNVCWTFMCCTQIYRINRPIRFNFSWITTNSTFFFVFFLRTPQIIAAIHFYESEKKNTHTD